MMRRRREGTVMTSPPFGDRVQKWQGRRAIQPAALDQSGRSVLDGRADRVEDRADLAAQEDQGDDRDDGDQREDEGVLGETLAFVIVADGRDECDELRHVLVPPFLRSPGHWPGRTRYGRTRRSVKSLRSPRVASKRQK